MPGPPGSGFRVIRVATRRGAKSDAPLRERIMRRAMGSLPDLERVPACNFRFGGLPAVDRVFLATVHKVVRVTATPATGERVADLGLGPRGASNTTPRLPCPTVGANHG